MPSPDRLTLFKWFAGERIADAYARGSDWEAVTHSSIGGCYLISSQSQSTNDPSNLMNPKNFLALLLAFLFFAPVIGMAQDQKSKRLFTVIVDDKRGYIDASGNIVIQPQFDGASDFSEGLAVVATGTKEGYIDETGKLVIEPRFDTAQEFSEGLAAVGLDDGDNSNTGLHVPPKYKWGYIDRTGKFVVEPKYLMASAFSQGLAAVKQPNHKYIFIDRKGNRAFPSEYEFADSFSEGLACVKINGKYGFIDKTGAVVIKPEYASSGTFREGLAAMRIGGRIITSEYETIIGPIGGRWVYIDKTGKRVIEFGDDVDSADNFSEGLAGVGIRGKDYTRRGYIDKTGKFVIEPRFSTAGDFSDGLARIVLNPNFGFAFEGFGYIDRSGNIVLSFKFPSEYQMVNPFFGGLASVETQGTGHKTSRFGYIDKSGKVIWPPSR